MSCKENFAVHFLCGESVFGPSVPFSEFQDKKYSILQYVNQCWDSISERKHNTKKKKIMLVYAFR
jgi:hypothetical protein